MNFRHFGRQIFTLYERYPLTLNSIVGGVVYIGGELITQINQNSLYKPIKTREDSKQAYFTNLKKDINWYYKEIDWKRTKNIGALGSVENGVFMLAWYKTLSRIFGDGVSTRIVLIKCFCDQIFFATQQDFLFLALCAYSDSSQLPSALEEVKRTFFPTWLMDCSLWPLVNFVGFSLIPYTLQPTYMAFVQFFWQLYVSSIAAKDPIHQPKAATPHIAELKKIFYSIDIDHNGFIEPEELLKYIQHRQGNKLSTRQITNIIKEVDSDGDGLLSLEEFERAVVDGKASSHTTLWRALHDDVKLLSGVQSAMKRFKEFQSNSEANVATGVAFAAGEGKDIPDSDMMTAEEQYKRDLDSALQSAQIGFSVLAVLSIFRRTVFKI